MCTAECLRVTMRIDDGSDGGVVEVSAVGVGDGCAIRFARLIDVLHLE